MRSSGHRDLQAKIRSQVKALRKSTATEIDKRTEETRQRINTAVPPPRPKAAEHLPPLVLSKLAMRDLRKYLKK